MRSITIRRAIASLFLATCLAGCATSKAPPPEVRVTLPDAPDDLPACFRQVFPEIPDRDLTTGDVVRIIGRAKVIDRAKSACGERALAWIAAVRRAYAKPAS